MNAYQKRLQTIQAKKKKPEPEKQVVKKQVASISDFTSYSQCPVPLTVIYCRDIFGDGHQEDWILLDTRQKVVPSGSRTEYGYRTRIEEQHRQLKCFSDLTSFTSVALEKTRKLRREMKNGFDLKGKEQSNSS